MKSALAPALLLASAMGAGTGQARAASATVATAAELQAAVASAQAGDTITLLPGSYVVTAPLPASAAGTASANIRVATAQGAHTAAVVAGGNAEEAVRVSGPFWSFDGVDLAGGSFGVRVAGGGDHVVVANATVSGQLGGVRADCGGPDAQAHCDEGRILRCDITGPVAAPDCTFAGIEIVGGLDWSVQSTKVRNLTVDPLCAGVTTIFGLVARGNTQRLTVEVVRISGVAVGMALGTLTTDPCEVRGAVTNGSSCTTPTACEVQASLVRNVVIERTSDDAVLLQNACDVKLHNATLWNDGTDAAGKKSVETRGGVTVVDVSNTILNAAIVVGAGTTQTGAGNLTLPTPADPSWFLDAAGGNFRLAAGTPPIDNGVTLTDVPTDYDGLARPQGSAYDVGAFERPLGGYPDGGVPVSDGGTDGAVGSATGGFPGGMTGAPKESGCQCSLGAGGSALGLALPLLIVIMLIAFCRRFV